VFAGLALFVLFSGLAAAAYPGGTFCDPDAERYSFWGNFFCDLTQPVTQRGADNARARLLARASFFCFSLALAPFFWVLGGLLSPRVGRAVRVAGLVSAFGTNVVAWLPSAASPLLHQSAVFAATLPGLVAVLLGVSGLLSRADLRACGVLGAVALLLGAADAAYYAYAIAVPGCHAALPALQKLAALCLMAWMVWIARLGRARAPAT
jgi:uncharacterized membrane protein